MAKNKAVKEKSYKITKGQVIGLFLGALISILMAGIFGAVTALNTDHFTLIALVSEVDEIKSETAARYSSIDTRLGRIETFLIGRSFSSPPNTTTNTTNNTTNTDNQGSTNVNPSIVVPEPTMGGIMKDALDVVEELLP